MASLNLPPFLLAASSNDISQMEIQSISGDIASICDAEGKNALHYAATEGHIEAADWLLEHGFSIETKTKKGLTPFHYAVYKNQIPMAKWLYDHGANVASVDSTGKLVKVNV
jgi:ankyrin repeat protein